MREEGINLPDPSFDIEGNPEFDKLEIENEDEFETAFENCEEILRKEPVRIMSEKEIDSLKKNPLEHEGTTIVSNVTEGKNSIKKAYIESYGCQMKFDDSEVVASILHKEGYSMTDTLDQA